MQVWIHCFAVSTRHRHRLATDSAGTKHHWLRHRIYLTMLGLASVQSWSVSVHIGGSSMLVPVWNDQCRFIPVSCHGQIAKSAVHFKKHNLKSFNIYFILVSGSRHIFLHLFANCVFNLYIKRKQYPINMVRQNLPPEYIHNCWCCRNSSK